MNPGATSPGVLQDKEEIAAEKIAKTLDELNAGPIDLALCGGACGGDLIFAEACLQRGMRLEMHMPFEESKFLQESSHLPAMSDFIG